MKSKYVVDGSPSSPSSSVTAPSAPSALRAQTQRPRCGPCSTPPAARSSAAALLLLAGLCAAAAGALLFVRSIELCVTYEDASSSSSSSSWCASSPNCSAADPDRARQRVVLGETRHVFFHVEKDMPGPIQVEYQLDEFYQTGREYVRSRSDAQLMGTDKLLQSGGFTWDADANVGDPDVAAAFSSCKPLVLPHGAPSATSCKWNTSNAGALEAQRLSLNLSAAAQQQQIAPPCKVMWPCGLIVGSFFNDVFTTTSHNASWTEKGIAWASDTDQGKYANPTKATAGWDYADEVAKGSSSFYYMLHQQYPKFPKLAEEGVENEHFIVWMRTAALPTFRNVYAKLEVDKLSAGEIVQIEVTSRFDVSAFGGKKSLLLRSGGGAGGMQVGWTFLVLAACAAAASALLFVLDASGPRMLYIHGERSDYKWDGSNGIKVE